MRRNTIEPLKLRLLATVMLAGLVSACSSDVARFSDNPFQNPFSSRTNFDPPTTSSINRGASQQAQRLQPVVNGAATTQPLPAPNQPMIRQQAAAVPTASTTRLPTPMPTGSVASAAYPQLAPSAPRATTALGPSQGWTAVGGTPVTLQQGETLNTLSGRYGVPVSALLAVNGLSSVNAARPGQQIMIPTYNAVQGSAGSAPRVATAPTLPSRETMTDIPRAAPVAPRATVRDVSQRSETEAEKRAASKLKQMRQREEEEDRTQAMPPRTAPKASAVQQAPQSSATQDKLAQERLAQDKLSRQQAAQEKAKAEKLRIEAQRKRDAEMKAAEARKIEEQKKLAEAQRKREAQKVAAAKIEAPETTASIPESKVTRSATPAAVAPPPAAEENASSGSSFRWPAQGRVINGFGGRSASGSNDGINIAVPEGTPVRAAEGGTVIHADDALKGYGKLVLVRHANGYVTVYAHNSDIKVKRGENVRRGQVIAASGSSGNVTSPQLHFQVRKGSQALDPMKVLSSN